MNTHKQLKSILQCMKCTGALFEARDYMECGVCHERYQKIGNAISFIKKEYPTTEVVRADSLIYRVKNALRTHPKLFLFVYRMMYPRTGKTAYDFIVAMPSDAIILNVGSGVLSLGPRIIDIDYVPYPNVSVVTNAHHLPFRNASVDAVISEALLEHVQDPLRVVKEITRVLRPGGKVYILVPFVFGFHSAPDDYYRWTTSGLQELLRDFEKEETGIGYGPTSAMTTVLREWLAIIFSFGSSTLYQYINLILMLVFTPINWIDFLVARYRFSSVIANGIYFIGKKK